MDHHQQPAAAANLSTLAASLTQIAGLFQSGMLTEAEFAAAKSTVLGLVTTPPRGASAAAAAAAPVLATVLAEEVTSEPPVLAAAAAHVPSPTLSEDAARPEVGTGRKPSTPEKRKRAGNDLPDAGKTCVRVGCGLPADTGPGGKPWWRGECWDCKKKEQNAAKRKRKEQLTSFSAVP